MHHYGPTATVYHTLKGSEGLDWLHRSAVRKIEVLTESKRYTATPFMAHQKGEPILILIQEATTIPEYD